MTQQTASSDSLQYGLKYQELEPLIGSQYDELEDDGLHILETTHRCSSMVENFNSRLRPYLDKRQFITPKRLALILFYLNHKPFSRSKHELLVKKTPAEVQTPSITITNNRFADFLFMFNNFIMGGIYRNKLNLLFCQKFQILCAYIY